MTIKNKKSNLWKTNSDKKKYLENVIKNGDIEPTEYKKETSYIIGSGVHHFKFGLGFVIKIISHSKIIVYFSEDESEKVLLQNWNR